MQNLSHYIGFMGSIFLAICMVSAGMPLLSQKVKRNLFYGFYLSRAGLKHDAIWYPVNKIGGRYLIIIGFLLSINSLVALIFLKNIEAQIAIVKINIFVIIVGMIVTIVKTALCSRRLRLEFQKHKKSSC